LELTYCGSTEAGNMRIALIADTHLSARAPECVANWHAARRAVERLGADLTVNLGDITLDGQGDPNAVFIMQSASSLTIADGAASPGAHARILLTNGAKASNVWWQVASSATIGSHSEFQGNILAAFDITMKTGSTACGR
jgi:hypothetical protein